MWVHFFDVQDSRGDFFSRQLWILYRDLNRRFDSLKIGVQHRKMQFSIVSTIIALFALSYLAVVSAAAAFVVFGDVPIERAEILEHYIWYPCIGGIVCACLALCACRYLIDSLKNRRAGFVLSADKRGISLPARDFYCGWEEVVSLRPSMLISPVDYIIVTYRKRVGDGVRERTVRVAASGAEVSGGVLANIIDFLNTVYVKNDNEPMPAAQRIDLENDYSKIRKGGIEVKNVVNAVNLSIGNTFTIAVVSGFFFFCLSAPLYHLATSSEFKFFLASPLYALLPVVPYSLKQPVSNLLDNLGFWKNGKHLLIDADGISVPQEGWVAEWDDVYELSAWWSRLNANLTIGFIWIDGKCARFTSMQLSARGTEYNVTTYVSYLREAVKTMPTDSA